MLLAVPNVSEGRDPAVIATIGAAYMHGGARLLDTHADPDHHRSVHTLAAAPGNLSSALVAGARAAVERIDLRAERGVHPHVGALDVAPVVFLDEARRGAACAEALTVAERLAEEAALPVFLYGLLSGPPARTRADLRRGGIAGLTRRIAAGELTPDFGPAVPHPSAGAVLVAARPPLVAFNLELAAPATLEDARRIAALIRESGPEGLAGVRAIGLELTRQGAVAQVSTNVEDHRVVSLAEVVAAVGRHARVAACELVGLAPQLAFRDFPAEVPVKGRRTVEEALGGEAQELSS
ncbi:MAG: glutamate formiminotransferase / 5-formyltetrahydrofolate cyclo-ligase [Baekduia sp.]|nr:glutamate formiminotransferase / 5-formyltetrahydrofolate cyclo-ligase [Baekduia sp.]